MAKKWPLVIATYILIPLVKVLSDGGDEVQYQGFCLIFDIDGASSIKIFTLLSIFVWVKLVVPKSDLFLCTVLQPAMSRSVTLLAGRVLSGEWYPIPGPTQNQHICNGRTIICTIPSTPSYL